MLPQRIADVADLQAGLDALKEIDPAMASVIEGLDEIPLRNRNPGFRGLAEIIVAQQVSKASAAAIFGRLLGSVVPFSAASFLAAGEQAWIDAGLSRSKQRALAALAKALEAGDLDLDALCELPPAEAEQALTTLPGIGPWTAEVFLLFCAWHPDIFPAGDVALQHAAGWIAGETEKPDRKATIEIAERWQPQRSIAARVLYAEYARRKGRSALPV